MTCITSTSRSTTTSTTITPTMNKKTNTAATAILSSNSTSTSNSSGSVNETENDDNNNNNETTATATAATNTTTTKSSKFDPLIQNILYDISTAMKEHNNNQNNHNIELELEMELEEDDRKKKGEEPEFHHVNWNATHTRKQIHLPPRQRPLRQLRTHPLRQRHRQQRSSQRYPFVTLAYAQSLDGKVALKIVGNNNENEDDQGDNDEQYKKEDDEFAVGGDTITKTSTPTSTSTSKSKSTKLTTLNSKSTNSKSTKQTITTSSNYAISGKESLRLTHALRSIHDGILIGGKTLLIDNPRLTNRLWQRQNSNTNNNLPNPQAQYSHQHQPRPIVLDTHLTYIRQLGNSIRAGIGPIGTDEGTTADDDTTDAPTTNDRRVIVCCSQGAYQQALREGYNSSNTTTTTSSGCLIPSSVVLLPCRTIARKIVTTKTYTNTKTIRTHTTTSKAILDLSDVLFQVKNVCGIQSIMVEGGGCIITAFLEGVHDQDHRPTVVPKKNEKQKERQQPLLDYLCVTISPQVIGKQQGYGYGYGDEYNSFKKVPSALSLSSLSLFSLVSSFSAARSTPVTMMDENEQESEHGRTITTTTTIWPRRRKSTTRQQRQPQVEGGRQRRRPPQLLFPFPVRYTTLGDDCVLYSKILRNNEQDHVALNSIFIWRMRLRSLVAGILDAVGNLFL